MVMADALETLATTPAPPQTASPFHQPVRDNAGNLMPELEAHQQKPDAPRRGVISDNAYHGLSAEEQGKYAAVRRPGDQGGSEWVPRDQLAADSGIDPAKPGEAPAPPQTSDGQRYKFGDLELTPTEISELVAHKAQADLRKATIPAAPEAYKVELPADFQPPAGVEFKFDASNPALVDARNWAHSRGLSQDDFSQMLGLYAAHEAGKEAVLQERARAEIAKIGPNAGARVNAVGRWLDSFMGSADSKPIKATLVTDAHLRMFEKVMTAITSQGAATFDNRHRDRGPQPGTVDDATWSTMSAADKLNYTRQFDQKQFSNPR
jgi:hypothetical protein